MMKSQKVRSLAATTLLTGASCVGAGCASTPEYRSPPAEPCPPGWLEALEQFGIEPGDSVPLKIDLDELRKNHAAAIREKEVTVPIVHRFRQLPSDTPLYGKLYFSKNLIKGRFTRARLRSGEFIPVCMELVTNKGFGIVIEPGDTLERILYESPLDAMVVSRFDTGWKP